MRDKSTRYSAEDWARHLQGNQRVGLHWHGLPPKTNALKWLLQDHYTPDGILQIQSQKITKCTKWVLHNNSVFFKTSFILKSIHTDRAAFRPQKQETLAISWWLITKGCSYESPYKLLTHRSEFSNEISLLNCDGDGNITLEISLHSYIQ